MITIGVIADTHVPDRVRRLDVRVPSIFRSEKVGAILHAGDITSPALLAQLGEIAPVHAVRGNRDWIRLYNLPLTLRLEFSGVQVGMMHGHGGWWRYLRDKPHFLLHGYHYEYLMPRLRAAFQDEQVIVFGHGHQALNFWHDGQLFFNPGSPHFSDKKDLAPSIGLLHISAGSEVRGEIIRLP